MSPTPLEKLETFFPEIKYRWKSLLRDEPVLSPLGRPDTLVFLMDATLTQFLAGFRITPEENWLRACTPIIAPLHLYCACGLDPLRKYFVAGESALRAVASPLADQDADNLAGRFRMLAQREIEAVCRACHNLDIPGCCPRVETDVGGKPPVSLVSRFSA